MRLMLGSEGNWRDCMEWAAWDALTPRQRAAELLEFGQYCTADLAYQHLQAGEREAAISVFRMGAEELEWALELIPERYPRRRAAVAVALIAALRMGQLFTTCQAFARQWADVPETAKYRDRLRQFAAGEMSPMGRRGVRS